MRLGTLTAVLLLLPAATTALAQDLQTKRAEAVRAYVSELELLASWCERNKLYAVQHACFELLLEFAPEHREARRTLKYFRQGDGTWGRRPYRPPGNHNEELLPEARQRYEAAKRKFARALLAAIRTAKEGRETGIWRQTIADVLRVEPDNAEARALNGEAKLDGRWVLVETATAKRRSRELKEAVKAALEAVGEPKKISPTDDERKLGVTWKSGLQGEIWRALGTVGEAELKRAVRHLDASPALFDATFGTKSARFKGCGFYLLTGKSQAKTVLENHPAFTPSRRKYLLQLSAAVVPGTRVFFQWSDSPGLRLDGSARMAIGMLMMSTFGVDTNRGWVWEGLGLYLDYLLTGSRRTFFVTKKTYTTTERAPKIDIEGRIKAAGADWLAIARQMLDEGQDPDLREMTRKEVMEMAAEDLVYSYALAAFIVEGYPKKAGLFFILHGNHEPMERTVEKVFGIPLAELRKRFERWLRERT